MDSESLPQVPASATPHDQEKDGVSKSVGEQLNTTCTAQTSEGMGVSDGSRRDQGGDYSGGATGKLRTSSRERKLTEKGLQQQFSQLQHRYRATITAWRRHASHLDSLFTDTRDISLMKRERIPLEEDMKRITSAYEELTEVVSESEAEEQYQRFESIQADHLKMTGRISKWISDVDMDLNEGLSM